MIRALFCFMMVFIVLASAFEFMMQRIVLKGTIPVLMYHFVGRPDEARGNKNYVSTKHFRRQMDFLKRHGYRVISMDEYYELITGKEEAQGREVLITFDDGNQTFRDVAYDILKEHGFPVTLFVVTENVEKELHSSMSVETLKALKQEDWITIGSHSNTHPNLSKLGDKQKRSEIVDSRKDLQVLLNHPIEYISYPSGVTDPKIMAYAREAGYKLGFATSYQKLRGFPETVYSITRVKISRTSDNLFSYWVRVSGLFQRWHADRFVRHHGGEIKL